jgi:quinol monooxygenase YgiN
VSDHGTFRTVWSFTVNDVSSWLVEATSAIEILTQRAGFVDASVIRSADEPDLLLVLSQWIDVGSYRRALSSTESKMGVWPFLAHMHDQSSAFETLIEADVKRISQFDTSISEPPVSS